MSAPNGDLTTSNDSITVWKVKPSSKLDAVDRRGVVHEFQIMSMMPNLLLQLCSAATLYKCRTPYYKL